ncbi:MAG: hypothetical protein AABW73_03435 [Nanoarchaeota archaeon]
MVILKWSRIEELAQGETVEGAVIIGRFKEQIKETKRPQGVTFSIQSPNGELEVSAVYEAEIKPLDLEKIRRVSDSNTEMRAVGTYTHKTGEKYCGELKVKELEYVLH